MYKSKISEKTIASKFKRLNYFHGQLLTENDLLEEQTYYREKLKLHNRFHGKGIVRGLEVTSSSSMECSTCEIQIEPSTVTIQPGLALDCEGNEVIVCRPYNVDLKEIIECLERMGKVSNDCSCETPAQPLVCINIGIIYDECLSNPSTQYVTTCSTESQQQYSRIREGFRVVIDVDNSPFVQKGISGDKNRSCSAHSYRYPGVDPDYSKEMVIPLAQILICNNKENKPITEITPDKIIMTGVRQYCWTAETFESWENSRKNLLPAEYDISCIINKSVEEARVLLEQMGMNVESKGLPPSKLTLQDFELIRKISPNVLSGSNITLIVDEENGDKVLFGIPNREGIVKKR